MPSRLATVMPHGPAPTTMTSVSRGSFGLAWLSVVSDMSAQWGEMCSQTYSKPNRCWPREVHGSAQRRRPTMSIDQATSVQESYDWAHDRFGTASHTSPAPDDPRGVVCRG